MSPVPLYLGQVGYSHNGRVRLFCAAFESRTVWPAGALGATLSGSGPTVIVWATDDGAEACSSELAGQPCDFALYALRLPVAEQLFEEPYERPQPAQTNAHLAHALWIRGLHSRRVSDHVS